MKDYSVPPSLPVVSSEEQIEYLVSESVVAESTQKYMCMYYEEKQDGTGEDSMKRVDLESDRILKQPLKNKWEMRKILWYNKVLWYNKGIQSCIYDGTDDYVNLDGVDGVNIILLD